MFYIFLLGNFLYVIIFLLGVSLGSFLNAWVWRTRENFRITSGRSMCPVCRRQLRWYENIPILSFLALKGKCRTCKNPIPKHFIFVEAVTPLILMLTVWSNLHVFEVNPLHFARDMVFAILLIIIFVYDFLYQEILSEIVWFGALSGLFFNFYLNYTLSSLILGAIFAGGFFLLQFVVSRGRWIGGGDVRFGFMMGLWLGWPVVVAGLVISYVIGAATSLLAVATKRKRLSSVTPFGTYLSLGTIICVLWGNEIVSWYMGFLR